MFLLSRRPLAVDTDSCFLLQLWRVTEKTWQKLFNINIHFSILHYLSNRFAMLKDRKEKKRAEKESEHFLETVTDCVARYGFQVH